MLVFAAKRMQYLDGRIEISDNSKWTLLKCISSGMPELMLLYNASRNNKQYVETRLQYKGHY